MVYNSHLKWETLRYCLTKLAFVLVLIHKLCLIRQVKTHWKYFFWRKIVFYSKWRTCQNFDFNRVVS